MASFDRKWVHAQFFLAWKLVRHWLLKLWPWAQRFGFHRFQENYVAEGIPPSSAAFRLLAHEPGRCTACNACDEVCPILRGTVEVHDGHARSVGETGGFAEGSPTRTPRVTGEYDKQFLGPMTFVLSAARQAPQLEDVKATLATLNGPVCEGCRLCDATCPERIPIAKLAVVVEEQRIVIARARQGTLPIPEAKRALPPWVGRGGTPP